MGEFLEGDGYVSLCPELDVASQGDTVADARDNLIEALTCSLNLPLLGKSTNDLNNI